jgi:ABC-type lipoprotein export system ATPase subunit
VVAGKSGYGKSTLMAVFVRRYTASATAQQALPLVHFLGLSQVQP